MVKNYSEEIGIPVNQTNEFFSHETHVTIPYKSPHIQTWVPYTQYPLHTTLNNKHFEKIIHVTKNRSLPQQKRIYHVLKAYKSETHIPITYNHDILCWMSFSSNKPGLVTDTNYT
jgi:hypothetical protein